MFERKEIKKSQPSNHRGFVVTGSGTLLPFDMKQIGNVLSTYGGEVSLAEGQHIVISANLYLNEDDEAFLQDAKAFHVEVDADGKTTKPFAKIPRGNLSSTLFKNLLRVLFGTEGNARLSEFCIAQYIPSLRTLSWDQVELLIPNDDRFGDTFTLKGRESGMR
jgi:hypothetical protein